MQVIDLHNTRAVTLVSKAKGVIEGYASLWGSSTQRDAYNTWFDRAKPPEMALDFLPLPLIYEHGMDGAVYREIVGRVTAMWFDDKGIRFRGTLDQSSRFFGRMVKEIKRGELATSTGSVSHLSEFDDDGRFVRWILGELSLTKSPAEGRMPSVQLIRSIDGERDASDGIADASNRLLSTGGHMNAPVLIPNPSDATRALADLLTPEAASTVTPEMLVQAMVEEYGPDAVTQLLQQMAQPNPEGTLSDGGAPASPAPATNPTPSPTPQATAATIPPEVQSALAQLIQPRSAPRHTNPTITQALAQVRRDQQSAPPVNPQVITPMQPGNNFISVSEPLKYARLNMNELMLGHMVIRSRGNMPSSEYMTVMAGRALEAAEAKKGAMAEAAIRSLLPRSHGIRANELATSTAASGGDEWVTIAYSTDLWEKARSPRIYQDLISRGMREEEVAQGQEGVQIPLEGADPILYSRAQNADVGSDNRPQVTAKITRIGTDKALLVPGEMVAAVGWSDTFEEDSVINVLRQYQQQINEKAEEGIEDLLINGDTATGANTNINLIDGTPGTGLSSPAYLISNGILKYPLVTNTAAARDAGSIFDETDFRQTLKLLPQAIRSRKAQLAFLIDGDTHNAALDIAAIKTEDVKRTNATIVSGLLKNIYGVDVLESGFMSLANSAGKIPGAGGTRGRMALLYAPYWAMAWKRRVTVETQRDALSGTTVLVVTMRIGFMPRGAGASAVSYNIAV